MLDVSSAGVSKVRGRGVEDGGGCEREGQGGRGMSSVRRGREGIR